MAEGVDYSFSRPDVRCLFNSRKRFAVRYVGSGSSGKYITRAEANALIAAGLKVAIVYQTTANSCSTATTPAGPQHGSATTARSPPGCRHGGRSTSRSTPTRGASAPPNGPWCRASATAPRRPWPQPDRCLRGYAAIARLVPTYAAWGWQTYAWSGGRWSAKAHLRQYLNGQNRCGGEVELCRSVTDDYGQWPIQEDDVTPEEHEWLRQVRTSVVPQAEVNDGRFQVRTHIQTELVQNNGRLRNIIRQELAAEPNVDAAAVAARVLAVLTPEAIAAAIPDTLAADVANELHQRLAD